MTITDSLEKIQKLLNVETTKLSEWEKNLKIQDMELSKNEEKVIDDRKDLIDKQNIILKQVDGIRVDKERVNKKYQESIIIKKEAEAEKEETKIVREHLIKENEKLKIFEVDVSVGYLLYKENQKEKEEIDKIKEDMRVEQIALSRKEEALLEFEQELLALQKSLKVRSRARIVKSLQNSV